MFCENINKGHSNAINVVLVYIIFNFKLVNKKDVINYHIQISIQIHLIIHHLLFYPPRCSIHIIIRLINYFPNMLLDKF